MNSCVLRIGAPIPAFAPVLNPDFWLDASCCVVAFEGELVAEFAVGEAEFDVLVVVAELLAMKEAVTVEETLLEEEVLDGPSTCAITIGLLSQQLLSFPQHQFVEFWASPSQGNTMALPLSSLSKVSSCVGISLSKTVWPYPGHAAKAF